ncbi:glycosyltransferase family 39 protein [Anabaena sp. PCC 7108]|uniref:glycosyltransferase family 39 protein n=1 Tax=Anabaena sp. PCC 7108 TaxID=163908 RepID=UPI0003478E33|nr:glycosyltransferase family 39 protein [Anabaena sp. PCC 7108]
MSNSNYFEQIKPDNIIKLLIVTILALGIFFRFVNIDKKVFWFDETYTSLRVSGYTYQEALTELKQKTISNKVFTLEDLQKYQRFQPEKGLQGLLNGLSKEEAQLTPLYFIAVQTWVRLLGDSVAVTRSVSALVSLLTFPGIYWLSQLLFKSPMISWCAVIIIAVSPFHVLYAQEARPYSWLTALILLSSAAFLKAIQSGKRFDWAIYTLSLTLGLYTHLYIVLVAIAHGVYILFNKSFRLPKIIFNYAISSLISLVLFCPWVIMLVHNLSSAQGMTSWLTGAVPIKSLVKAWLLNISRLFFDFNYSFIYFDLLSYLGMAIILILVLYSLYFLIRHTKKQTWSFIIILILFNVLPLSLLDIISGGKRSAVSRYLIPAYLGIQIAVAHLIVIRIFKVDTKEMWRKFWKLAVSLLISISIVSCIISSQTDAWWIKLSSFDIPKVAKIININKNSLVICQGILPFDLSYNLKGEFDFLYPTKKKQLNSEVFELEPTIIDNYQNVFVLSHNVDSSSLLDYVMKINSNFDVEKEYTWRRYYDPTFYSVVKFWQLEKKS